MEERASNQSDLSVGAPSSRESDRDSIFNFERRNTRVLVVDEDQAARQQMVSFLEASGFPTTACASGLEALELIKREDFGMIITDIHLSDFDGLGLIKAVKVINANCDVIIITGSPSVETAVASMRLGAAEYFSKPLNLDQLGRSIDRLVERRVLERKLRVERHQMDIPRFDDETGLFSNRYFHFLLAHEIGRCRRYEHSCGLLLTGIDGLKDADTNTRHPAFNGDRAMKFIAHLLRSSCRQIDFIARYAYDEFALLLPESGDLGLQAVTARIRHRVDNLNEEMAAHNLKTKLIAVCGGATFPHSGTSKDLLLSSAYENLLRSRQ
jgi:diguanylate cyclase (GGDEF)-like protein